MRCGTARRGQTHNEAIADATTGDDHKHRVLAVATTGLFSMVFVRGLTAAILYV